MKKNKRYVWPLLLLGSGIVQVLPPYPWPGKAFFIILGILTLATSVYELLRNEDG